MTGSGRKRLALHWRILIGMAAGAGLGVALNALAARGSIDPSAAATAASWGKGAGDLFLRLLSMVVAPLIFTSMVAGITSTGSLRGLGRMGAVTFLFYIVTGMIAILTGIALVNLIEPGVGSHLVAPAEAVALPEIVQEGGGLLHVMWTQVQRLVPKNPIAALADPENGSILGVIFFALLFGVFVVKVGGAAGKLLTDVFSAAFEVMMALITFLIGLAPIGVFGFMLSATAGQGLDVFKPLGLYMLTVFLALCAHGFVTLPIVLLLVARRRPGRYARQMAPALLTAFSTASSNATLPLTLSCSEKRAGIPNRVGSFVLPVGASINTDGTALYEAVAALFIAQVYGIHLGFEQQAVVAFTALLAGIGAAGVPHAGLVMMIVVLKAVGLPLEAVGLILGVDRVLDMCRTTLNVWGDCSAIAVVHRLTGGGDGDGEGDGADGDVQGAATAGGGAGGPAA